jgi:hypothetical protein
MHLLYCPVLDHCGSRKNWANGFFDQKTEFSTHCLTKTLRKHHKKLDKLIYSLKQPSQNLKSTINKKSYQDLICFSWHFQGKKPPNMSPPR